MEIVPAKHISRITGAANLVVSGQQRPRSACRSIQRGSPLALAQMGGLGTLGFAARRIVLDK
jgi:hypothetical protein